jgi:chemotaxis protein methyltransferase CheR
MATSFEFVRALVRDEAGIVLDRSRAHLVEARLSPLARQEGLASIDALVEKLRRRPAVELQRRVVDAMTTNETTFFRDVEVFEALRTRVLPALIEQRRRARTLRLWCAASSTGQEPYSIAMLIREAFPELAAWNVSVLGSDISGHALARAVAASYSQSEVGRGLPSRYLVKYFVRRGLDWELVPAVKQLVSFQYLNLNRPWPASLPTFDVIFVRNAMIYFDAASKRRILAQARDHLQPHGFLFLGAGESTGNLDDRFARVQLDRAACYQPASAKAR